MGESSPLATAPGWWRGVRGWFAEASDAVVSVFFLAGRRICEKLLVQARRLPFCEECLASFEAPLKRKCEVCGRHLRG
jgi:hypothetical protein